MSHKDEMPYDEILRKRESGWKVSMGKHEAANAGTCERIISQLERGDANQADVASWALWMVWWRLVDSRLHLAVKESLEEQIAELREEIDQLRSEQTA